MQIHINPEEILSSYNGIPVPTFIEKRRTMNQKLLRSTMLASIDRIMETFEKKNAGYAPDGDSEGGDALAGFRRAAALDGTTMEATLWGFLKKHLVSIGDLALSEDIDSIPESVWQEKVGDMIVYGLFLEAMIAQRQPVIQNKIVTGVEGLIFHGSVPHIS